jgi:hypothetical protein
LSVKGGINLSLKDEVSDDQKQDVEAGCLVVSELDHAIEDELHVLILKQVFERQELIGEEVVAGDAGKALEVLLEDEYFLLFDHQVLGQEDWQDILNESLFSDQLLVDLALLEDFCLLVLKLLDYRTVASWLIEDVLVNLHLYLDRIFTAAYVMVEVVLVRVVVVAEEIFSELKSLKSHNRLTLLDQEEEAVVDDGHQPLLEVDVEQVDRLAFRRIGFSVSDICPAADTHKFLKTRKDLELVISLIVLLLHDKPFILVFRHHADALSKH